VVFVTTAGLSDEGRSRLAGRADMVIERENTGYDFYSWKTGLERCATELSGFDEVLLLNSSVLGPVKPLAPVFAAMDKRAIDFWGFTDNYETGTYHLQSFFLVFRRAVLASAAFRNFWRAMQPVSQREAVITAYEVPLLQYFTAAGFRGASYIELAKLRRRFKMNLFNRRKKFPMSNPTLLYPQLLHRYGMPFIKIELLRHNPRLANLRKLACRINRRGELDALTGDLVLPAWTKRRRGPCSLWERLFKRARDWRENT
jgi:rhamnosyltransferase